MQERLHRSRRHRTWVSSQVDGASVGGDSSIASTENVSIDSSDKHAPATATNNSAKTSSSSTVASGTAAQLKTYRLQKIKQKFPSRHHATGGTSSTPHAAPTPPSASDDTSPQVESQPEANSSSSPDENRDSSSVSFRRQRISTINLKTRKTPGSPTKSPTALSNPRNGPASACLEPLDTQQEEREYSVGNGKHQGHSPCESMMYQASAMEEGAGDDDPSSSEGPPPGPRMQRMQRDGSRYRQVSSAVQSWKSQHQDKHHLNRDDESESTFTSTASTDWKSQPLVDAGGASSAGGTTEVSPEVLPGRVEYRTKSPFRPPEVQDKTPSTAAGSHQQYGPNHHASAYGQPQRPSQKQSSGGHVHGVQEPSSWQLRHYGTTKMASSHELNPVKQKQYGGRVVTPVHAPVTHGRTYVGRSVPFKDQSQLLSTGGRRGPVPGPLPPNTHPTDDSGQLYKNVLKPRRKEVAEPMSLDKPDYSKSIETPKIASVSSLRASFDSNKNQPLMPMNSTDPRVRHSLPISNNKKCIPEAPTSPAKTVPAQRLSVSGGTKHTVSYRSTESATVQHCDPSEPVVRAFKPNQDTQQQELNDLSHVSSDPVVARATSAGTEKKDGIASRYRSAQGVPAWPIAILESRGAASEVATSKGAVPSNDGTAFRHSTHSLTNQRVDAALKNDTPLRNDLLDVVQYCSTDARTEELEVNAQRKPSVASSTKKFTEDSHGLDEARKSWQRPSLDRPKESIILNETTLVRTEVNTKTVDKNETIQTNRIGQYYKASWRVEQEDEVGVMKSIAAEEGRTPEPTIESSAPVVTRGSVAASWQQRIQQQNQRKEPIGPATTDILKSKPADASDVGDNDMVSTQQPGVPPWMQMLNRHNSKDSSSSSADEKKEAESPPKSSGGVPSQEPVIASPEIDVQITKDHRTLSSIESASISPRQSLSLNWQQKALATQRSKDSSIKDDSQHETSDIIPPRQAPSDTGSLTLSKTNLEIESPNETDQQSTPYFDPKIQNPLPQNLEVFTKHENATYPDELSFSPSPIADDFRSEQPEPTKAGVPIYTTSKPWEKDTRHSVLQSWQTRSLKVRDKDTQDSSIQPDQAAPDFHESPVPIAYDDEDFMEEKRSGDLSVDEDTILGVNVDDYLGNSNERADFISPNALEDSLKETSKRLSYDGGVDSYISADTSTHEDELALHHGGSMNVRSVRSLTELSSEEISVYVEDDRTNTGKKTMILKENNANLDQNVDSESDRRDVEEETPKDVSSPVSGRPFPRLSPSPKDNGKYRNSYFGDEVPAAHRVVNRKKTDGGVHLPPGHFSAVGDGASQVNNFWASTSASREEHQEAMNFTETDRWLDRDPDIDDTIADDISISSEANEKNPLTTPKKWFVPQSQEPTAAGFDSNASVTMIQESTTWTPVDNLDVKSRSAKETQDVFDPFGPENDELKVDVAAELFSPNPDPFMTEESFSPLEWSTPQGTTSTQHIGYYNSPDSRVEI